MNQANQHYALIFAAQGGSELDTIKTQYQVIRDTGIILIVGGAVILIIAFFGCCGAIKEWRPLLAMYAIVLLLILAIEIAAIVYAAINRDSVNSYALIRYFC